MKCGFGIHGTLTKMENKGSEPSRQARRDKLSKLTDYKKNYSIDVFISDLVNYFDNEVDFNLEKIRKLIEEPGKLGALVSEAKSKNTHPVVEFVQEFFKDLYLKRE